MPVALVEATRRESDRDVIEVLERYLAQARAGQITGIAVAVSRPGEDIGTSFFYGEDAGHKLTAAVATLHHRVMTYTAQVDEEE